MMFMESNLLTPEIIRNYIEVELLGLQSPSVQNDNFKIGVELETFPYTLNEQNEKLPVNLFTGKDPLILKLLEISEHHEGKSTIRHSQISSETNFQELDKISFSNGNKIFFEPGGQIELSTKPCYTLPELEQNIQFCQSINDEISKSNAVKIEQIGISSIDYNLLSNQLQKPRYQALENYFNSQGPYGREMMLRTCAMHINIDLGKDENTMLKRIVACNLIVPFATAIFANSYLKKEHEFKSYRSFIWQNTDPLRTGILDISKTLENKSINNVIDAYYNFIINAPLIFIADTSTSVLDVSITLKYWMNSEIDCTRPTIKNLKNHISLLFPEVRLKAGYLELRTLDVPPRQWQMAPITFYAGLLYDDYSLDETISLLKPLYHKFNELQMASCLGLESIEIIETAQKLMALSIKGCSRLSPDFLPVKYVDLLERFNESYLSKGKTFADD